MLAIIPWNGQKVDGKIWVFLHQYIEVYSLTYLIMVNFLNYISYLCYSPETIFVTCWSSFIIAKVLENFKWVVALRSSNSQKEQVCLAYNTRTFMVICTHGVAFPSVNVSGLNIFTNYKRMCMREEHSVLKISKTQEFPLAYMRLIEQPYSCNSYNFRSFSCFALLAEGSIMVNFNNKFYYNMKFG